MKQTTTILLLLFTINASSQTYSNPQAADIVSNIIINGATETSSLSMRANETFTEEQLLDAVWVEKAIMADIAKLKNSLENKYPETTKVEYYIAGENKDEPLVQRIFPMSNRFNVPFVIRTWYENNLYRVETILRAEITRKVNLGG